MRVAGIASGRGRHLTTIADRSPGGAELVLVVTDNPGAPALEAARERGIETAVVSGDTEVDRAMALPEQLEGHDVDLACIDGYGGEVTEDFLSSVSATIAVHNSLLPAHTDPDPVSAALARGARVTGATVHLVTADHDRPIVAQEPVLVYGNDTTAQLRARVDVAADRAYRRAVRAFAGGRVTVTEDPVDVDLGDEGGEVFPPRWLATGDGMTRLRYGENPHQAGALYGSPTDEPSVVDAPQRNEGARGLSYNNYNDADAALRLVGEFDRPAAAVIKHTNPAGCATADAIAEAYDRALATDPMSAYGGIVALNRPCDGATAEAIADSFKEIVIAPVYDDDALSILREEDSLRVLDVGEIPDPDERPAGYDEKPLVGGRLVQERDDRRLTAEDLEVVTERDPTDDQIASLLFAWHTVKHVKSNAVLFAAGTETVGVGAGQMSRVDAVRLATMKADEHAEGKSVEGAVMASDAFFPFPDGVEVAAEAGIEAVIQPGGSRNDEDVIEAADELGLAMVFTDTRAFRHD